MRPFHPDPLGTLFVVVVGSGIAWLLRAYLSVPIMVAAPLGIVAAVLLPLAVLVPIGAVHGWYRDRKKRIIRERWQKRQAETHRDPPA
jgi:hypothetical protein